MEKNTANFNKIKEQYAKFPPEGWRQNSWGTNLLPDEAVVVSAVTSMSNDTS